MLNDLKVEPYIQAFYFPPVLTLRDVWERGITYSFTFSDLYIFFTTLPLTAWLPVCEISAGLGDRQIIKKGASVLPN